MSKVLLAVSGHAGSGKDTVADMLVREGFVKVALADPLKRICFDVFNFTEAQLWGPSEERNKPDKRYIRMKRGELGVAETILKNSEFVLERHPNPIEDVYLTPRYALQTLGTEWGRDCYKDVWIDYGLEVAQALMSGAGNYTALKGFEPHVEPDDIAGVVFSDIRFKNEFDKLRSIGGKIIRIRRNNVTGTPAGGVVGHASEEEQDEVDDSFFDAVIDNNGTMEELSAKVTEIHKRFAR